MFPMEVFTQDRGEALTIFEAQSGVETDHNVSLIKDGQPVNLQTAAKTGTTGPALPADWTARIAFKYLRTEDNSDSLPVIIDDAEQGTFHFEESFENSGIYPCELQIRNPEGKLKYIHPVYLCCEGSIAIQECYRRITVDDVRRRLYDISAAENTLLDSLEFTNSQIIAAIFAAIDEWNAAPPDLGRLHPGVFPWIQELANGACARLLSAKATLMSRNEVMTTGSTAVSDRERTAAYMQLAEKYNAEYRQFMLLKKGELTIYQGFATA